ncbi:MAG TPA: hypothetical protein PKK69_02150 [Ferruginibacter sp.]|nr:hypothetical protein [Ferruginibacter sp.]
MKTVTTGEAKTKLNFQVIAGFLETDQNRTSRWVSYIGLSLGVLMLLASVQMYLNVSDLIKEKNPRKNGYDYISVTKTVTNENMGKDNRFTQVDIQELKSQPFIEDAAPLLSNQFRAKASAGNIIPFSTDLFVESIQHDFIDTVPPEFNWKAGQLDVPIIMAADYLEMYNVFAPSQDLPQLSASSISSVNIVLECYGPKGMQPFRGHVVALTDRINSILVPYEFLTFANEYFGGVGYTPAARVSLKTADANSADLMQFLDQKNYHVNKEKTKFGRVKQVLQAVISGLGIFAILVIVLAMMLFSFYLQLMIARSRENLQLLLTLGYSPNWLSKTVARRWIPLYTVIVIMAMLIASAVQWAFHSFSLNGQVLMSPFLHPYVWLLSIGIWLLCVFINARIIRRLLFKLA